MGLQFIVIQMDQVASTVDACFTVCIFFIGTNKFYTSGLNSMLWFNYIDMLTGYY